MRGGGDRCQFGWLRDVHIWCLILSCRPKGQLHNSGGILHDFGHLPSPQRGFPVSSFPVRQVSAAAPPAIPCNPPESHAAPRGHSAASGSAYPCSCRQWDTHLGIILQVVGR